MVKGSGRRAREAPVVVKRRAPYGPEEPLGARGLQARDAILVAAYEEFGRKGYRATTIDDIAVAVGRSRAAVYQYFGSKAEIFVTLTKQLRADMEQAADRLGPLSPDAAGDANVRGWLAEIGEVIERHEVTLLQGTAASLETSALWQNRDAPVSPYTDVIMRRMREAGVEGVHHRAASYAVVAMVEKSQFYRRHLGLPISGGDLTDALAAVVQMVLFPGSRRLGQPTPARRGTSLPRHAAGSGDTTPSLDVDRSLEERERARRIRAAAAAAFLRQGVHQTSVSEIAAEAGIAHGTFYLYWRDKAELVASLAADLAADYDDAYTKLTTTPAQSRVEALPAWVDAYADTCRRHAAIMAFWAAEQTFEPQLDQLEQPFMLRHVANLTAMLEEHPQPVGLDPSALTACLLALLGHFPFCSIVVFPSFLDARLESTLTTFLTRGFLH